jgi:hypothetical protein
MMRVNNAAMYMIPLMSEFEILSSTKNAERMRELETEIILKILDKLMSITAILFFIIIFYSFYSNTSIYIDII